MADPLAQNQTHPGLGSWVPAWTAVSGPGLRKAFFGRACPGAGPLTAGIYPAQQGFSQFPCDPGKLLISVMRKKGSYLSGVIVRNRKKQYFIEYFLTAESSVECFAEVKYLVSSPVTQASS